MIKISHKLLIVICMLFVLTGVRQAFAQVDSAVTTVLTPHSSDGTFSSTAAYTFEVKNHYDTRQVGKVSYTVLSEDGKRLKRDSVLINLPKKTNETFEFSVPGLKTGFYKINFMVNLTDYDDTTRRAFGIKPDEIHSPYAKPADFDSFWQNTMQELAKVKPEYKMTELPDSSKDGRRVFLVEMKSLDGLLVRGFLTEPVNKNKHKKFAVLLALPGYQVTLGPMFGKDPDIAIFTINIRGSGYSRDVINVRRESYIVLNLEDKNKYVLRGAIMDCVRAVDFICTRPELKHDDIIAAGGSLGGFLSLATSAIDKRISFCSAANPILCDVRNLVNEVDWPFIDIRKYVATRPGLTMDKVLNNMDYFDGKNFGANLKCPTLVGLGLVDPIAPPNNVYAMYNGVKAPKHIILFRDLGHEIGKKYNIYEGRWMRDTFALF